MKEAKVVDFREDFEEDVMQEEEIQEVAVEEPKKRGFVGTLKAAGNWVLNLRVRDLLIPVVVVGVATGLALYAVGKAVNDGSDSSKDSESTPEQIDAEPITTFTVDGVEVTQF